ncbi:hypothetical protein IAT40_000980 [Kwoniella sp. CBS 6097]
MSSPSQPPTSITPTQPRFQALSAMSNAAHSSAPAFKTETKSETETEKAQPIFLPLKGSSSSPDSTIKFPDVTIKFPDVTINMHLKGSEEENADTRTISCEGSGGGPAKRAGAGRRHGSITEAWWAFNFLIEISRLEERKKKAGDHRVGRFVPGLHDQFRRKDEA